MDRASAPLLLPAGAYLLLFLAGLASMAVISFRDAEAPLAHYRRFLGDPFYLGYLWRSFRVALYCTPVTLLLAYPVAYVMARATRPVRLLMTVLLVVQFFTSYVIRGYALMAVLGNNGLVNRTLLALGLVERPVRLMYNELGVAIGLVVVAFPFMVFPIYSVLKNIRPSLGEAAAGLGARPSQIFWTVTLPLSLPGVAAGVVLVFLFDLTAFVIPGLLGAGFFDMIANLIFDQALSVLNPGFAAAAAVLLLGVTLLAVYGLQRGFARFTEEAGS